ncbi:MAG: hypothetical protein ACO38P_13355 [Phycisphaerales bacterium]
MHGTLGGMGAVRRQKSYDDPALLRRLYLDEGMTIAEIARDLGATSVTIQKYLKKYEIPSRGRGPRKGLGRRRAESAPQPEISDLLREHLLRLAKAAIAADERTRIGILEELKKTISGA